MEKVLVIVGPTAVGKTALSIHPVSYTHLDVYKRQALQRLERLR
uniref:tRNA dimethylallyltransferase n=1 Tax=Candidatus Enterococcus clewellii TaxID=1834193 RepID=A0A242K2P5_9ENTE|nr:hypothetical protein [Enterococcus sp. 9E7_DIV0242]OTP12859.1 hypothetical protein A5888_003440 [Enterococcus sp. 9E7_DIV0242]